jgi:type II restriction enzyme
MSTQAPNLNAGEKAELYVKLHVLAGEPVFTLDADSYSATERNLKFHSVDLRDTSSSNESVFVEVPCGQDEVCLAPGSIDPSDYLKKSDFLKGLAVLRDAIDGNSELPETFIDFLNRLGIRGAGSATNVDLYGRLTGLDGERKFGFSIKSFVGSQPTLLNASQENTNFRFKIVGDVQAFKCLESEVNFSEISTQLNYLKNCNLELVPLGAKSTAFQENLAFFGEGFDVYLGSLMLDSYLAPFKPRGIAENAEFAGRGLGSRAKDSKVYALQGFLRAAALGLTSKKPWQGRSETYGGYLILNQDYSVTSVGIQNDDDFRQYLYDQTIFESPSRTRHKYGHWYLENGTWYIDLNLQIRFRKP